MNFVYVNKIVYDFFLHFARTLLSDVPFTMRKKIVSEMNEISHTRILRIIIIQFRVK